VWDFINFVKNSGEIRKKGCLQRVADSSNIPRKNGKGAFKPSRYKKA
jgi:hypothetical protein